MHSMATTRWRSGESSTRLTTVSRNTTSRSPAAASRGRNWVSRNVSGQKQNRLTQQPPGLPTASRRDRKFGVMFAGVRAIAETLYGSPPPAGVILCQASSMAGTPLDVSWPPTQSVGSMRATRAPSALAARAAAKAAVEPPAITTSKSP